MANKISAELLRPLDGDEIGTIREFSSADFNRLKNRGAVKAAEIPSGSQGKARRSPANKMASTPKNKAVPGVEQAASPVTSAASAEPSGAAQSGADAPAGASEQG